MNKNIRYMLAFGGLGLFVSFIINYLQLAPGVVWFFVIGDGPDASLIQEIIAFMVWPFMITFPVIFFAYVGYIYGDRLSNNSGGYKLSNNSGGDKISTWHIVAALIFILVAIFSLLSLSILP